MPHELLPGSVVKSRAGRDKGKHFMIYSLDESGYAYLVDGVLRKLASPKRKKLKHIEATGSVLHAQAEKIEQDVKIFDAEVRHALEEAGYSIRPGAQNKEGHFV